MRLIFMGTPASAAECLSALIGSQEEIAGVVTQPDRPKGRHLKAAPSAVKELALKNSLKVYQPEKVKDPEFIKTLRALNPDLIVVMAYGKILPKEILEIPKYGALNVHLSLLPRYRGASPVQAAILEGETETGVTIMRVDEHLDTGDIFFQEKIKIEPGDTAGSLEKKLSKLGAQLLLRAIQELKKGPLQKTPQDHSQATWAPPLTKENGVIDWKRSALDIHNQIRAFQPWPSAYTVYKGKMLKVLSSELGVADLGTKLKLPGTILEILKGIGFVVATGKGHLLVKEVQPQDRREMPADDFVRGYGLKAGDVLE